MPFGHPENHRFQPATDTCALCGLLSSAPRHDIETEEPMTQPEDDFSIPDLIVAEAAGLQYTPPADRGEVKPCMPPPCEPDRTIAEIIGWPRNPDFQSYNSEDEWITTDLEDDGEYRTAERVEADDLLAWLTRDGFAMIEIYPDPGVDYIQPEAFDVHITYSDKRFHSACRPTVFEALEDIVRAADKETS